jgi:UDP-N-acetylglucosamine enolpyruvyl transferase
MSPVMLDIFTNAIIIDLIKEIILPWKKKFGSKIDGLEKEKKNAEVDFLAFSVLKDQREKIAEINKRIEDIEKQLLVLEKARASLALDVVERINPELSKNKKLEYAKNLLEPIKVLTNENVDLLEDIANKKISNPV